jgi:hypothetical protein
MAAPLAYCLAKILLGRVLLQFLQINVTKSYIVTKSYYICVKIIPMIHLQQGKIEAEITKIVEEINAMLGLKAVITVNTCPDDIGISSQILISVMSR